jgi:hypothetical protein
VKQKGAGRVLEILRDHRMSSGIDPSRTILPEPFMTAPFTESVRSRAQALLVLAGLLERLERSPVRVDPAQYRTVVNRLSAALSEDWPDDLIDALLKAHPSTAELYENLHYARSGLSRAPLDRSVASEQAARALLSRIARA